jgi:SAM-dependent methyltransferase
MIYCFDIDGTLCTNTEGDYEKAEPFTDHIARVNALHALGHRIILFTARGSTTGIDWRARTEEQLARWGVRYHELLLGKPRADVYVDDKGLSVEAWRASTSADAPLSATPAYLDVTYSEERAPRSDYPERLAAYLRERVYRRPGRLLDVGCGRGEHLAAFSKLGFEVTGVDVSPRAREHARGHQVVVVDLEREPLPFPEGSFDHIFSKSVVEHMRNPGALLAKTRGVLRAGGRAAIMTPSWAHTYWGPFYVDHTHVTPFTAPALVDALTIAGFRGVEVSHFYQLPHLWRYPRLKLLSRLVAALPLPYRPFMDAPWPEALNKLIRFSKELMLLGVGEKPRVSQREDEP